MIRQDRDGIHLPSALLLKPVKISKYDLGHSGSGEPVAGVVHSVQATFHMKKLPSREFGPLLLVRASLRKDISRSACSSVMTCLEIVPASRIVTK